MFIIFNIFIYLVIIIFKKTFYLFIFRQRGREREREGKKHQFVVASRTPLVETWLATQLCALTSIRTSDLLIHRLVLNRQSHTSQDNYSYFFEEIQIIILCPIISTWKSPSSIIWDFPEAIFINFFSLVYEPHVFVS